MRHQTITAPARVVPGTAVHVGNLLIVDDHPLMCEALTMTLKVGVRPEAGPMRTQSCRARPSG